MSSTRNELDKSVVKKMELVLNRFLKRYDWFEKIELENIGYSPSEKVSHFTPVGTIYVDGDWLYERWREYHYEGPFPDLYDEDWGLSFGDFIGGDLSEKFRDEFTTIFAGITGYLRPKYISWSWLKVRMKDDETQNLIESIRRALKESNVKNRLENLIDKLDFIKVSKSVGGIHNISKVLGMSVVEVLNKYFVGKELSTDDIKDVGIDVGGYEFKFTPTYVSESNDRFEFIYKITEGELLLIMGTGETFDLFDDKLREKDYWWEIEYEISELLKDYSFWLLESLNYEDIDEMLRPHADFYFDTKK